ncbi:MAG: glutamine--fructose-6-phosphate transaminase (isomerizing) [bacterium]|nr:glutamine--fructose-6-phosphate transaminase (isomerizing) [bacterium]
MCGIVGYVGARDINAVILAGLWKLEYRGYDSSGIATIYDGEIRIKRAIGKLKVLADVLDKEPLKGNIGIGHTRWATHGEPSEENAHPQLDCSDSIAVVHNGIIENYINLKEKLIAEHHIFRSFTDTEVIPHTIEKYYTDSLENAVIKAMNEIEGSYAFAVISTKEPNKIVCCKKNTPLVIGVGEKDNIVASDILAIVGLTRKIIYLEDNEICTLTKDSVKITDRNSNEIKRKTVYLNGKVLEADKGGFSHFMLKEIYEQPKVIHETIEKRLQSGELFKPFPLSIKDSELVKLSRILIQACGTSWHAGHVGKYIIESLCRIHTEVDISSEFRYRNPVTSGETLVIAISQSGETADTLAGIREAKLAFLKVLSIVNVAGSTIARESNDIINIDAGPEIGVASTKAYTGQLFALYLFALYFSRLKWITKDDDLALMLKEVREIPSKMQMILDRASQVEEIARKFHQSSNFIFLGRGINYPSALEGALKLKEVSYIHATGYPAGEMKHGPIALVDKNLPIVCIIPKSNIYEKMFSNIEEVKARGGQIIAVATEGDKKIKELTENIFYIPECSEILSPLLVALPLQLLAYYISTLRGLDVDKPRNLAKSVTVE